MRFCVFFLLGICFLPRSAHQHTSRPTLAVSPLSQDRAWLLALEAWNASKLTPRQAIGVVTVDSGGIGSWRGDMECLPCPVLNRRSPRGDLRVCISPLGTGDAFGANFRQPVGRQRAMRPIRHSASARPGALGTRLVRAIAAKLFFPFFFYVTSGSNTGIQVSLKMHE